MAKATLLLADKDPRSLRILELALRKAGFGVVTAADGGDALKTILATPPDLVLCDLSVSGKDGLAVCRAVRKEEKLAELPFLLMGGDKPAGARSRAIEAGADEYLAKPILLRELVQRVEMLLERRKLKEQDGPAALTGSVANLGLVDLFQSLENWRKTAIVRCEAPGQHARVWMVDGQIIDAELGPLAGDAAFWRLMTWDGGDYRVEYADVEREERIADGTQGALMEAMRRVDELGGLAEQLPMNTQLALDVQALLAKLADLPDEANAVVRCFDGKRTLREALDLSPVDDLSTFAVVQRLMGDGVLRASAAKPALRKPSLQQWLSDPPRPGGGAPRAPALDVVHFPPLRGARRERLRREAEEARTQIAGGRPVRLTRVVELPAFRPDGSDAISGARFMSPAVGDAAKKFAPDAPVSRLFQNGGSEAETAPSFRLSDAEVTTPATPVPMVAAPPAEVPPAEVPPAEVPSAEAVLAAMAAGVDPSEASAPLPQIAPVLLSTPPPQVQAQLAAALGVPARRRRWPLIAALAAAAIAAVLVLRAQPATDKKDAPWLEEKSAQAPKTPDALPGQPPLAAPLAQTPPPAPAAVVTTSTFAPTSAPDDAYAKALAQGDDLLRRGKYRAALREFKRASSLQPDSVPALLALGDAYLEADLPKSAVKPLESAARKDASSGRAHLLLGTAYQSLGRNLDAARSYRRYLELEPAGEFSKDVQQILAGIGSARGP